MSQAMQESLVRNVMSYAPGEVASLPSNMSATDATFSGPAYGTDHKRTPIDRVTHLGKLLRYIVSGSGPYAPPK